MKFEKHIFICTNERNDPTRKSCGEACGMELIKAFKKAIKDNNLKGKMRTQRAGCLDACDYGPSMVVYPEGIYFLNDKASVVTTKAAETIKDLLHQRIRWAGKWKYNQSLSSTLLAVFIFIFQLSSITTFILIAAGFANAFLILMWIAKILLELLFLKQVNNFLNNKWKWLSFILLQLIYPVYVVYIGLISNFKSFEWKGRKLKSIHSNPVYH